MPHEQADNSRSLPAMSLGFLGDLPISEIHPTDVEVWHDMLTEELRRNPAKAERLNRLARTLRRADGDDGLPHLPVEED